MRKTKYSSFLCLFSPMMLGIVAVTHSYASEGEYEQNTRVASVNHVSVDIAVDPDVVWNDILENFSNGGYFLRQGYEVKALKQELPAFRGGYSVALVNDLGEVIDQRTAYITERDDEARRLSLYAQYHSATANGLEVHVTYQAFPIENGARYLLDAYSVVNVSLRRLEESGTTLKEWALTDEEKSQEFLEKRMQMTKKQLEALIDR